MATQTAISVLEKQLRKNSRSLSFSRLADLYRKAGSTAQAVELCIKGLEQHPTYITGRLILGRCYLEQDNLELAAESFSNVCRLDRRNIVAIKMLADIFMRQGFSEKAGDLYVIAVKMDPYNETLVKLALPGRRAGAGKSDLLDILGMPVPPNPAATVTKTEEHHAADSTSEAIVLQTASAATPTATSEQPVLELMPEADAPISTAEETPVEAATADLDAGEALAETIEITGTDISERMTAIFSDGESPAQSMPPVPAPEATADAPIEVIEAPSVIEVPDGDTISSRIDELFNGEPSKETVAVSDAVESHHPPHPEPEIEELMPKAGLSLEETMILDADEVKKMRAGFDFTDNATQEEIQPLIIDEEECGTPKAEEALELITDDAASPDDLPLDSPPAEDLIIDEPHTVDDLLRGIENTGAPLIEDADKEPRLPASTISRDNTISGDDVAQRIEGIFGHNQARLAEKVPEAMDSEATALSSEEAVTPAGTQLPVVDKAAPSPPTEIITSIKNESHDVDETIEETLPIFSGDDIEKRLDEFFADAKDGTTTPAGIEETLPLAAFDSAGTDHPRSRGEETIVAADADTLVIPEERVSVPDQNPEAPALPSATDKGEETIVIADAGASAVSGESAPDEVPGTVSLISETDRDEETIVAAGTGGPDAPGASGFVPEPPPGSDASAGTPPPREDDTDSIEETLEAHPLDDEDIDAQSGSAPVPNEDKKESTAVFEEFSPDIVPEAPPPPPEVPLFTPEPGTPLNAQPEAVVGNFDMQDKLYDIPDHVLTPTLADLYYQQGQPKLALSIYRRLLERDSGNDKLRGRIEEIDAAITAGNVADVPVEQTPVRERKKPKRSASSGSRQRPKDREEDTRPLAGVRIKKKPKITWKKKGG